MYKTGRFMVHQPAGSVELILSFDWFTVTPLGLPIQLHTFPSCTVVLNSRRHQNQPLGLESELPTDASDSAGLVPPFFSAGRPHR